MFFPHFFQSVEVSQVSLLIYMYVHILIQTGSGFQVYMYVFPTVLNQRKLITESYM